MRKKMAEKRDFSRDSLSGLTQLLPLPLTRSTQHCFPQLAQNSTSWTKPVNGLLVSSPQTCQFWAGCQFFFSYVKIILPHFISFSLYFLVLTYYWQVLKSTVLTWNEGNNNSFNKTFCQKCQGHCIFNLGSWIISVSYTHLTLPTNREV